MRFTKGLLTIGLVATLAACASDQSNDSTINEDVRVGQREEISDGPFDNGQQYEDGSYGRTYGAVDGPAGGTQQDLVVNIGDRVFFGYDQYNLTSDARRTVEKQVAWLEQYPNLSVTIEGHCDERGTREYNLALGEKRASAVKNYMVALGISPSRVSTISYGKERPAIPESNPSAWAQNRRSVTKVQ